MGHCCCAKKEVVYQPVMMPQRANNCICNFPTLIILILIVLQFSRPCCKYRHDESDDE